MCCEPRSPAGWTGSEGLLPEWGLTETLPYAAGSGPFDQLAHWMRLPLSVLCRGLWHFLSRNTAICGCVF